MSYFVEDFDPTAKRALLTWARDDYDSYDAWGWAMSWLFDICGELYNRGAYQVPFECQFQPSPLGIEITEDRVEGIAEISTASLEYAGRVISRYENLLRATGHSY